MDLVSAIYSSRVRLASASLDDAVADILAVSVARDKQANVTGGLVYDCAWFAQVLAGDRRDVEAILRRILQDTRHGDVCLLGIEPIEARLFPFWWMGGGLGSRHCGAVRPAPRRNRL
jgi:hypothetical protein